VEVFPAEAPSQTQSRAQYGVGVRAVAVYPAVYPAVYLVEQQHLPLVRGTLVSWIGHAARILAPVELRIKDTLAQAASLHHDETGMRGAGQLAWAHVTSTSRLTHYAMRLKHPKHPRR
jgi:hypothetical protein